MMVVKIILFRKGNCYVGNCEWSGAAVQCNLHVACLKGSFVDRNMLGAVEIKYHQVIVH
jgi:hypothetical protein